MSNSGPEQNKTKQPRKAALSLKSKLSNILKKVYEDDKVKTTYQMDNQQDTSLTSDSIITNEDNANSHVNQSLKVNGKRRSRPSPHTSQEAKKSKLALKRKKVALKEIDLTDGLEQEAFYNSSGELVWPNGTPVKADNLGLSNGARAGETSKQSEWVEKFSEFVSSFNKQSSASKTHSGNQENNVKNTTDEHKKKKKKKKKKHKKHKRRNRAHSDDADTSDEEYPRKSKSHKRQASKEKSRQLTLDDFMNRKSAEEMRSKHVTSDASPMHSSDEIYSPNSSDCEFTDYAQQENNISPIPISQEDESETETADVRERDPDTSIALSRPRRHHSKVCEELLAKLHDGTSDEEESEVIIDDSPNEVQEPESSKEKQEVKSAAEIDLVDDKYDSDEQEKDEGRSGDETESLSDDDILVAVRRRSLSSEGVGRRDDVDLNAGERANSIGRKDGGPVGVGGTGDNAVDIIELMKNTSRLPSAAGDADKAFSAEPSKVASSTASELLTSGDEKYHEEEGRRSRRRRPRVNFKQLAGLERSPSPPPHVPHTVVSHTTVKHDGRADQVVDHVPVPVVSTQLAAVTSSPVSATAATSASTSHLVDHKAATPPKKSSPNSKPTSSVKPTRPKPVLKPTVRRWFRQHLVACNHISQLKAAVLNMIAHVWPDVINDLSDGFRPSDRHVLIMLSDLRALIRGHRRVTGLAPTELPLNNLLGALGASVNESPVDSTRLEAKASTGKDPLAAASSTVEESTEGTSPEQSNDREHDRSESSSESTVDMSLRITTPSAINIPLTDPMYQPVLELCPSPAVCLTSMVQHTVALLRELFPTAVQLHAQNIPFRTLIKIINVVAKENG